MLILIGMQPPNDRSVWVVGTSAVILGLVWFGSERRRFPGPPRIDAAGRGDTSNVPDSHKFSDVVEPVGDSHARQSADTSE